jgi:putative flippase GtrA
MSRPFHGLLHELGKFGAVGIFALIVDVGGFNLLRSLGDGSPYGHPIVAKLLSASASTVVAWSGHRLWTFRRHRRSQSSLEFGLFVLVCALSTLIAVGCLATSHQLLGFTSATADNVSANGIGLVLGTAFRFWAYRSFVFNSGRKPNGALALTRRHASQDVAA